MAFYNYTESGLDNVIIEGVNFITDDSGEDCITIANINGLHRAIATSIVTRPSSMTGREFRFLRVELGMTQSELGLVLHRGDVVISRWERGESPIDKNAEVVFRLMAIKDLALEIDADISEVSGWCIPSAETPPIRIDGSNPSGYAPIAA